MHPPDDHEGRYVPPADQLLQELAARKGLPSTLLFLSVDTLGLPGDMTLRLQQTHVTRLYHLIVQSREELLSLGFAGWEVHEIEQKLTELDLEFWDDAPWRDRKEAIAQLLDGMPLSSALWLLHQVVTAVYMQVRDPNVSLEEPAKDQFAMYALRLGSESLRRKMPRAEFRDHNELLIMVISGALLELAIGTRVKSEAQRLDAMAQQ